MSQALVTERLSHGHVSGLTSQVSQISVSDILIFTGVGDEGEPPLSARRTAETLAGPNAGASRIDFKFQLADSEAGPGVHMCHPP
jgi:hypothetical protein